MFVRMKAGLYNGEVKDIEFTSAKSLIASGLAEVAFGEDAAEEIAPPVRSERIESVETSAGEKKFAAKKKR